MRTMLRIFRSRPPQIFQQRVLFVQLPFMLTFLFLKFLLTFLLRRPWKPLLQVLLRFRLKFFQMRKRLLSLEKFLNLRTLKLYNAANNLVPAIPKLPNVAS